MGWEGFVVLLCDLAEFGQIGPWDRGEIVVLVMVADLHYQHLLSIMCEGEHTLKQRTLSHP